MNTYRLCEEYVIKIETLVLRVECTTQVFHLQNGILGNEVVICVTPMALYEPSMLLNMAANGVAKQACLSVIFTNTSRITITS